MTTMMVMTTMMMASVAVMELLVESFIDFWGAQEKIANF